MTPLEARAKTPLLLSRAQAGSLVERPVTRLFHDLWVQSWTGSVLMSMGGQRRRFAVLDGAVGTVAADAGRERRLFLESFAWSGGTYRLDGADVPAESKFTAFGELMPLLLEGVFDHASGRDLMQRLAAWSQMYPLPTQHLAGRVGLLGRPRLARLIEATCDGRHTLDEVVKRSASDPVSLMRLVYFAVETHMLLLLRGPGVGVLHVEYENLRRDHHTNRGQADRRRQPGTRQTGGLVESRPITGRSSVNPVAPQPSGGSHGANPTLEPHPAFLRGEQLLVRGKAAEAQEAFAEALRSEPRNPAYLTEHLWAAHGAGRVSANDAARHLLGLLPDYGAWGRSRIHTVLGRIAKSAGREEAAFQQFEAATRCDPQAVEARREQRLYHMRQHPSGADSWVDKLLGRA